MHTFALMLPMVTDKLLRTVAVYFFLLIGLRLAGKRELGQLNPFDLVVLLLLSNTVQNAIIGPDETLTGGIIGATVLLLVNWIVVRFLYSHPHLDMVLEGEADWLMKDGKIIKANLRKETITVAELELAARKQGFQSLDDVDSARLEIGGALTFVAKHPSEEEERHQEVLTRLDSLVAAQTALAQRLDAMQGSRPR
jgi:uncharacterized membrane protein YcaP (DUF421 family)